MTAQKGGAPVGNRNGLRHGVKSARVASSMRLRVHPELKKSLLSAYPRLPAFEIELGIGILVNLRLLRRYIDTNGIISSRGQVLKAATEWDRQLGRWDEWTRRNERYASDGKPLDNYADLIDRLGHQGQP